MDEEIEFTQQEPTPCSDNVKTDDINDDSGVENALHQVNNCSINKYSDVWGILRRKGGGYPDIKLFHRTDLNGKKDWYTIGRSKDCDVVIEDKIVSNYHCVIYCDYSSTLLKIMLMDTSTHGTYINNSYIKLMKGQKVELKSADEIFLKNPRQFPNGTSSATDFMFINMRDRMFDKREISAGVGVNPRLNRQASNVPNNQGTHIEDFYVIGDKIGSGTCGQVHDCVKKDTLEHFAVKIIDTKKFSITGLSVEDLRQEAAMMKSLDHPYIIKVKDTFEYDKAIFIVMELLRGGDLFDRIIERGKYTEDSARKVMQKILLAVEYLHSNNIIHRDLKPENILLVDTQSDENIKLTDFGLAKKTNQEGLKTFCGTPQYFAPEVLKRKGTVAGRGRYNSSADVWSIGVILYILLSGTFPFEEERVYDQIMSASYSLTGPEWVDVSDSAKSLIKALMTLRPENRITVSDALKHPWITGITPPLTSNLSAPLHSIRSFPKPPTSSQKAEQQSNKKETQLNPIAIAFSKQEHINVNFNSSNNQKQSISMPQTNPLGKPNSSSNIGMFFNNSSSKSSPSPSAIHSPSVGSSPYYNEYHSPADGSFIASSQLSNRSSSQDSDLKKVYWSNREFVEGQKKSKVIEDLISKTDSRIGFASNIGTSHKNLISPSQGFSSQKDDVNDIKSPIIENKHTFRKSDISEKATLSGSSKPTTASTKRSGINSSPVKKAAIEGSGGCAPDTRIDSFFSKVMCGLSQTDNTAKTATSLNLIDHSQPSQPSKGNDSTVVNAVDRGDPAEGLPRKRGLHDSKVDSLVDKTSGAEKYKISRKKTDVKYPAGQMSSEKLNNNRFQSTELDDDEIIDISSDSDGDNSNTNTSQNNINTGRNNTKGHGAATSGLNYLHNKASILRNPSTKTSSITATSADTNTLTSTLSSDKADCVKDSNAYPDTSGKQSTNTSSSSKRKQKSPSKFVNNFHRKPVNSMHMALKK